NLIPFIDVLLVILIFLMLSTTYSRFTELRLELPAADAEPMRERPHEIVVAIAGDGRTTLNRQPVDGRNVEALSAQLRSAAAGRTDTVLILSADAMATHQSVVNVLDAARRAGLARLSFAAQNPSGPP
ncbi:MAG TPA: biopolymer transporter ExbD, partial [Rubrivivax sp.]|nr:biopolymer transporter ExbD [Rubrivivax sp.]